MEISNHSTTKKTNPCNSVNGLWPISLLPLPSKILEKIVYQQCITHLNTYNYLDSDQYGFQKNKSTITAISELTDDFFKSIEKKQATISIFIDFQKAFDKLDHKILLHKLQFFGFSDSSINFFQNYLSNRTQKTLVNNIQSNTLPLTHGIPQGSNLGPLLFLLYINDIGYSIKYSSLKLFADDTTIYCSDADITSCIKKLESDLKGICEWCSNNNMALNTQKN